MAKMERPIAAFDLDGTIYRGNLVSRLCEELCRHGYFSGLFAQNMANLFVQRDECQLPYRLYEKKLVNLLLVALRGKSQTELMKVANLVLAEAVGRSFVFTTTLMNVLRNSHDCIAVTGGLREIAEDLAEHWGFNACYSSILEVKDDLYTGKVIAAPVRDKGEAVRTRAKTEESSTLECSTAIGDTLSDIALLEAVQRPIVFNPDSELAARAKKEHWPVVLERKDVIYVLHHGMCQHFTIDAAMEAVRCVTTECRQLQ